MNEQPIFIQMSAHQVAMAWLSANYVQPLKTRSSWIIFAVVLALIFISQWWLGESHRFDSLAELGVGVLFFGGSWFLMMYTRVRRDRAVARMYVEGFHLALREQGLLYRVGESSDLLPWAQFARIVESRSFLYFFFNARWSLMVPRSAFANESQIAEWLEFARRHVSDQSEKLS